MVARPSLGPGAAPIDRGHIGENGWMVEDLVLGVAHLLKPPHPRRAGRPLENSWRLHSPGQIREGPARHAERRASRVGRPRLLSDPGSGQFAFGIARWP